MICLVQLYPLKKKKSMPNSFEKTLNDTDPEKINSNLLVDTGLNIIGKKIKKGISSITGSGTTQTKN